MRDRYRPMSFSIETERLSLRLRGPEDAAWNLELLGEHEDGTTLTLAEAQRHLAEQSVQAHESGLGFLAIKRRAEGDLIGYLGPSAPIRRNTLAAGDAVRGAMAYGLWDAAYRPNEQPVDIRRIFLASAALASLKCYAGSFVDFLGLLEKLRGTPTWSALWSAD